MELPWYSTFVSGLGIEYTVNIFGRRISYQCEGVVGNAMASKKKYLRSLTDLWAPLTRSTKSNKNHVLKNEVMEKKILQDLVMMLKTKYMKRCFDTNSY